MERRKRFTVTTSSKDDVADLKNPMGSKEATGPRETTECRKPRAGFANLYDSFWIILILEFGPSAHNDRPSLAHHLRASRDNESIGNVVSASIKEYQLATSILHVLSTSTVGTA